VQDGTAGEILGETVRVEVEADFNGVLSSESHVVIGDVAMRAVGKADSERLEGFRLKQFA
jgi:hypothetical protein